MAEFDKEESQKDLTHDLYYATVDARPHIIPPAVGFISAYIAVAKHITDKPRPFNKNLIIPFIAKFAVGGILGYTVATYSEKLYFKHFKQRILIVQDYIKTHPEQFVEQEPKKFKDVVIQWIPYR